MRIGVAGLGLIGGSLALALRARHDIRGFDVERPAREAARSRGIAVVDRLDALVPADAVIVATPPPAVLPTLASFSGIGAVLIDVSSVRGPVDAFAREQHGSARIVGMHPMAGRSASGFAAADAGLLSGRPFLIVPTARSDADAMRIAGEVARDAGGVVTVCSAAEHDRIVASISALPLVVAAALALVAEGSSAGHLRQFAGPGLRDASRLALTAEDLATQLLTANAGQAVAALARFRETLDAFERAIAEGDAGALASLLGSAREARSRLD